MGGYPVGRLNMDAELGTILGPDTIGQLMVVTARDAGGVLVSYATGEDVGLAREVIRQTGPRSLAERQL